MAGRKKDGPPVSATTGMGDPLDALLRMRLGVDLAMARTNGFGYEDFDKRMKALQKESVELFRLFDRYYSDPDPGPRVKTK